MAVLVLPILSLLARATYRNKEKGALGTEVNRPRIGRIRRIYTDQIRANPSDPPNPWSILNWPKFQEPYDGLFQTKESIALHILSDQSASFQSVSSV